MFWIDEWKLGAAMWKNAVTIGETAVAIGAVIRHRSGTIDAALRNSVEADVAELGRMVPEKVAAFSQAGSSLLTDWMAIQSDMAAQIQDLALIGLTSGTSSPAKLKRVGRRSSRWRNASRMQQVERSHRSTPRRPRTIGGKKALNISTPQLARARHDREAPLHGQDGPSR